MQFLRVEELAEKGIQLQGKKSFISQNKYYVKMATISKKFRDKIAEKYGNKGLSVIAVEHKIYFSIWQEESILTETQEDLDSFVNQRLREFGF